MDRIVLADCSSEQVRALIEEHNKMVEIVRKLALKSMGLPFTESPAFPRRIVKEE